MASNGGNGTMNFNSTGDGGPFSFGENSAKFNPTTAVVIISLIGGCFVLAIVSVFLRKYILGDTGSTNPQSNTTQPGSYNVTSKGLLKEDVDALPLVHVEDLDEKDTPRECPVCLADFEPEDSLRLLPTCKHVFHRDCIDAWFDAHSTCPLCRASLVGQPVGEAELSNSGGEHVVEAGDHGEPAETTIEVLESGVTAIESRQLTSGDVPLDADSRIASRISREDSARESLFRISESFKRITTGSDQQPITKNFSFRKPPVSSSLHRSSSLSADLIALRNLLKRQSDQNGEAPSRRWFSRARSLHLAQRDRGEGDEWVTIDLESGKAVSNVDAPVPSSSSSSPGESSKGPPKRAWSWSR